MLNFRTTNTIIFLACAGLIATAYYMEYVLYLDPCPLCMVQRIAVFLTGVTCLAAALHNPRCRGRMSYSIIQLTFCTIGAAAAGRHVWLQNTPTDKIPECFPGLGAIFEHNSLFDAFAIVIGGTGECGEVLWTFLGLSIPAWVLVAFALFGMAALLQIMRTKLN